MNKQVVKEVQKIKSIDIKTRTITAIASTETPDRYGDVVLQTGWKLENFLKNPVVPWGHDYDELPVARVTELEVVDGKLIFSAQFAGKELNPKADEIFNMYKEGFLNAFSVGFIPIKYEQNDKGGYTYQEQELLEISAVVVPANQEALAMAFKVWKENKEDKNMKEEIEEKDIRKTAVPYQDLPLAEMDIEWDANVAVQNVRKWASSDGSGEKDTIDWGKYMKGFLWYDGENRESFGAYKLPIADIIDGRIRAVPRAIFAAAAAIQGARGGVDIPEGDVNGVKSALEKYYEKMDRIAPWVEETITQNEEEEKENYGKEENKVENKIKENLEEVKEFEKKQKEEIKEVKMPMLIHDEKTRELERAGGLFKALAERDFTKVKALTTEADSGGYLVPEILVSQIYDAVVEKYGIVRPRATVMSMSAGVMNYPMITGKPGVTWYSEGSAISEGQPEFDQYVLAAKEAGLIIPITKKLLNDSVANIANVLTPMFAEAMGYEEDNQALLGSGTPFTGVFNVIGVGVEQFDATFDALADLTYDNLVEAVYALPSMFTARAVWVMNRTIIPYIKKLKDVNGIPIFDPKDNTLMGYPIIESDIMPQASEVTANTAFAIFGDLSEIVIGLRNDLAIDISDQATLTTTGNLWEKNMIAYKATYSEAIVVRQPQAFVVLKTGTTV